MPTDNDETETDMTDESTVDPNVWTGVYYDAGGGLFVELAFEDDGVVVFPEGSDEPATTYDSYEAFLEDADDLHRVPPHVVENPVPVAEDVYAKGFEELLDTYHAGDIAILYADQHTEIVETTE